RPSDGGWACRQEAASPGAYPQLEQLPLTTGAPDQPEPAPAPTADTAPATAAAPSAIDPLAEWDWVPAAQLTEAQRCELAPGCAGAYVEPPRDWVDADLPRDQAALRASATSSEWQGDTVLLEGGVEVTKGELRLLADRGELDRARQR